MLIDLDIFQLHHTGIKIPPFDTGEVCQRRFQLHHTGIKIVAKKFFATSAALFQLHHTGIKITPVETPAPKYFLISIAPYRN